MSLSFTGPNGWVEQRWIIYALLRDNVQHHLENGVPSEAFAALHEIGAALSGQRVFVPARTFRAELTRAKVLVGRPASELAIGARTQSVMSFRPLPEHPQTRLASSFGASVPWVREGSTSLGDVFGHLIDALLEITVGASESDFVEVVDM